MPDDERSKVEPPLDMFVEGAPDVGIAGFDVIRTTLVAVPADEGSEGDSIHWHVSSVPYDDGQRIYEILGDLAIEQAGWFVGVTVSALIDFREGYPLPDPVNEDAVNQLGQVLGPWSAHALYDVAALIARQVVATNGRCDVEVPRITPKAHITKVRRRQPADDTTTEDQLPTP